MGLKYIAYHNEHEESFAIVMMDNLNHAHVHKILNRMMPRVFTLPIAAGFTYYDSKKKTFLTGGDSAALNLVSNQDDKNLVNEAMLEQAPADVFVIEDEQKINWSFLFTAKNLITDDQELSIRKVFGRGSIAHHIHDSNHPFRIKLDVIKGFKPTPDYLKYVEQNMI